MDDAGGLDRTDAAELDLDADFAPGISAER
jgi:hypothetical protein